MSYSIYQPSGIVPRGAPLLAACCFALVLPAAGVYAWLIHQLPFVVNFLVSFAFALLMGSWVKRVGASAKVRNPRWCGRFGILLGLTGWYFQWAVWLGLQSDARQDVAVLLVGALRLAGQPLELLGHAWKLGSSESGLAQFVTTLSWLGELWMLLFFPHYMGKMRAEELFDESAGEWADYEELLRRFKLIGQAAVLRLTSASPCSLSEVLVAEPDGQGKEFCRLRVYRGRGDQVPVSIVSVEMTGEGKRERVVEIAPHTYLYVARAELDALLAGRASGSDVEEAEPPELAGAIGHLQAGNYRSAYEEALPFVSSEDNRLYCDANRLCAIACSASGQWTEAAAYWQALFAGESSAHNALQVATSSVMADRVEQGLEWAERARVLNAVSHEMPGTAILTNMLTALSTANHLHAALPVLEQLRDFYTHLHVTDPTFLFGHRVPLFHVFLEKSGAIVTQVLDKDARRAWYASMLPHLDERGKAELTAWLDEAPTTV